LYPKLEYTASIGKLATVTPEKGKRPVCYPGEKSSYFSCTNKNNSLNKDLFDLENDPQSFSVIIIT